MLLLNRSSIAFSSRLNIATESWLRGTQLASRLYGYERYSTAKITLDEGPKAYETWCLLRATIYDSILGI
jgi:hypothetical protein